MHSLSKIYWAFGQNRGGKWRSRGLSHLDLMLCLLPATRSLLPSDQLINHITPRHPPNTLTPLFYIERLRRLSFLDRAYSPRLTAFGRLPDQHSVSLDMSSSTSSATFGRKRRAVEELDTFASRRTRRGGDAERITLKSKLDQEFDQSSLLRSLIRDLDNVVALAFYDTEIELQREDAEQLMVYLSVSLLDYGHDRRLILKQHRFSDICELSGPLIVDLHKSFHKCKLDVVLSPDRLPLFLELSHKRASSTDGPDHIDSLMKDVLHDIQCFDKTTTFTTRDLSSGNSELLKSLIKVLSALH
jgi:hypothetical protein